MHKLRSLAPSLTPREENNTTPQKSQRLQTFVMIYAEHGKQKWLWYARLHYKYLEHCNLCTVSNTSGKKNLKPLTFYKGLSIYMYINTGIPERT